jgi:hypothetical protein
VILTGGQLVAVAFDTGQILALAIAAAVAIVVAIVALLALRGRGRSTDLARQEDAIRRDGILGRGIVLAASPTGRHRGDRDEIDLRLEVQLPMRRRFEVRRRDWLDADERGRLAVGAAIPVAADPNEPGHVVLVLDIPEVDPAAIAGLGPVAGGPGGPPRGDRPIRPTREERDTDH